MAGGSKNSIFAFDQYTLDAEKLMLYRDGEEVVIAPKVAKTLAVLVEEGGAIIGKDELIQRVWEDSIVEESNLTQYLYLLRKVLGTMPDGRPYIETLRRRGYRFNGMVEKRIAERTPTNVPAATLSGVSSEPSVSFTNIEREGNVLRVVDWQTPDPAPATAEPGPEPERAAAVPPPPRRKSVVSVLAIALVAVVAAGTAGILIWPKLMPVATIAESQTELSMTRLTNGYIPYAATISTDGNTFVYHEIDGEISRMFVQQTGQASRIEITSTSDQVYSTKTFTPDGQSIFYAAVDKTSNLVALYRIPTMGGAPVKVLDDTYGGVSFSPNGKEMVFTRYHRPTGGTSLIIASIDGKTERVVAERKNPTILSPSPSWSPDGSSIAFAESYAIGAPAERFALIKLLNVETGAVTNFSEEKWNGAFRLMWAPDGRGIAILGTRDGDGDTTRRDQAFYISYPGGVSRRLTTTEGNRHEPDSLGITRRGDVLAVPYNRSSQVWVIDGDGNSTSAIQLSKGAADGRAGLVSLPNGRFAYLARNADDINIMVSNADGTSVKEVATGFKFIEELRVDPNGEFFLFAAQKEGRNRLFRIGIDGKDLRQLTFGEGYSIDSSVSPDGKNIVVDSVAELNDPMSHAIVRIPSEGGEPVLLMRGCSLPTYSPDGSMVSCISTVKSFHIVVISAADGAVVETHPLPRYAVWNFGIGWSADGAGLLYAVNEKGVSNLWHHPRDGGKPRLITNFSSGTIFRFAFSKDGSKLYAARGYPAQDVFLIKHQR